jgi:uncharacterized protein (DUF2236 family)
VPSTREVLRGIPRTLPPGRPGDPGLFGPGSVAWRVNGEGVLMLGGPRALLMQIAHPAVAAGVAAYSDFPADSYGRLWRTVGSMLAISFGDWEQCRREVEQVSAVHRRVSGTIRNGTPYRATDPALLKWVHATLVDSGLAVYRRFFGRLSEPDAERYVLEMNRLAGMMGVPEEDLCPDLRSFCRYVHGTIADLTVSGHAGELAPWIVRPPVPRPLRPIARFQELVTVGLLPEALRRQYGLPWTPARDRLLRASEALARTVVPGLPGLLRRWPHARAAERRATGKGTLGPDWVYSIRGRGYPLPPGGR